METLKIESGDFLRTFKIKNIQEEDTLEEKLVYITFELYKQVCREVKKSKNWNDYTETRAYYIGHTLKDVLVKYFGVKVDKIRKHRPIKYRATTDEIDKIFCKVEFGSHKHFISEGESINYEYQESLKTNYGFCTARKTYRDRIWPFKPKNVNLNVWIGIKLTDPQKQEPVDLNFIFDATIHEFIHLLDNIEIFYSKNTAFEIVRPLLEKVLTEFFIFKKIGD